MKRFLFLLMFLAVPAQSQIRIGHSINDSTGYGFSLDTLSHKKVDPSKPWIWEVTPREQVRKYWFEEAACQGLSVPPGFFEKIRFYLVNAYWFDQGVVGYSVLQDTSIYLAYPFAGDPRLIKHEMLHYQLILNGYPVGHPLLFFSRCDVGVTYPP